MKALTIREVPDEIYATLKACARDNRRSLQQQVLDVLARESHLVHFGCVSKALRWRSRLKDRSLGNVVEDIRSSRRR